MRAKMLHESKTKWWVAPKRKIGATAKDLLKQAADCTALQSQIDWTSNHGTIKWKISNRSRIWSAAGWCPQQWLWNSACLHHTTKSALFGCLWIRGFLWLAVQTAWEFRPCLFFIVYCFVCQKLYKSNKIWLFKLSWRRSPREATGLIRNGLPPLDN